MRAEWRSQCSTHGPANGSLTQRAVQAGSSSQQSTMLSSTSSGRNVHSGLARKVGRMRSGRSYIASGQYYLSHKVFGFDLNPSLVRAAKMNMVMNNDGEGGTVSSQQPLTSTHMESANRRGCDPWLN